MTNVIDNFMVALGFEVDDKSAKDSQQAIDNIRTGAIAMGAVVAGSFLKAGFAAKETARDITDVYNTAKLLGGVGVSELDAFQYAFKQAGGAAEDAQATLASFEQLLANAAAGRGPFEELELAGIPPEFLMDTRTSVELLNKLSEIYPLLTDRQKQFARQALGLNRGADLLLAEGPEQLRQWLSEAEHFGVITEDQAKKNEKLTQSFGKVGQAWDDLLQRFSTGAAPGIAEVNEQFAELLNNFDGVADRLGTLFGDNFSTLAPASAAGTGAASLGGAGAAAQQMGMGRAGAMLKGTGKFLGTKVAGPLAVASLWNLDEDLDKMFGWDPKDHAATGWLFKPMNEVFAFGRDQISPPISNGAAGNSMHIERIDIRVDGSSSPEVTANRVLEKLNEVTLVAAQGLRTATAG